MKRKQMILLCLLFFFIGGMQAQIVTPIHWQMASRVLTDSLLEVTLSASIDEGWHLYGTEIPEDGPKPTAFFLLDGNGERLPLKMAASKEAEHRWDENFLLELAYYEGDIEFSAILPFAQTRQGGVEYMACNDQMCLPPTVWDWSVEDIAEAETPSGTNLWWLFLMGLLGGLLAIFTPCVWPIIPMTVSFFMKRSANGRALKDAVLYGVSIVVIYVVLGLLVTLIFGASALNDIATNAIINLFFFALLVLFAISFFGAFELTLPASWSTRLDAKARQTSGMLSILLMAFTLVIVSFSCTGPIIGTLLVEAAGKSLLAPAVGMLGFSIALALPFSLFALFPNWMKRLPRSGGWMDSFKVVLAFLELALSLKFFSVADLAYGWHLLDREVFLALWIVIFSLLGFYLLGLFHFRHEEKTEGISVFRFFLAVISLSFALYMVPGLWGATLKAISAFAPPMSTQDWTISSASAQPQTLSGTIEEALAEAQRENKRVLLDFSGYGCVNCRKMEAKVLSDERVQEVLGNYLVLTLIVDDKTKLENPMEVTENGKQKTLRTIGDYNSFLQRSMFGANAQPYYVKLSKDGERVGDAYSYNENINQFINWLNE